MSTSTSPTNPKPTPRVNIRLPTPSECQDPTFLLKTTHLINKAYSAPATTLLKPQKLRTNTTEVQTWLESGNFYLAFACHPKLDNDELSLPQHEHQLQSPVGTIRVHALEPGVSDLGILTVDAAFRSSGLGRALIAHAEGVAVEDGAGRMRIEVPSPRVCGHTGSGGSGGIDAQGQPVKKRYLRAWYEGLGV